MTLFRALMLVPVALSLWASSANASSNVVVIDFDNVEAPSSYFLQTVQVTNQYAHLGVIFSNPPVENVNEIINFNNFTSLAPGATRPNGLGSLGFGRIEGFFTVPVFSVGADVSVGLASENRLTAFDAYGNMLGSVDGDNEFVSLTTTVPIARFTVHAVTELSPVIDNLTFVVTEVPEPSSLLMGAMGLLGLLGWKRSRV